MRVASRAESIAVEELRSYYRMNETLKAELKTKILSAFMTGMNMLFEVQIIK